MTWAQKREARIARHAELRKQDFGCSRSQRRLLSRRRWQEENRAHRRVYLRVWKRWNAERIFAERLRLLKPEESLFTLFTPLDATPGFESHILVDWRTPLDALIELEEAA